MSKKNDIEEMIIDVDVSKLEVGMIVKNYRKMCELLGEEPCTSNSKKAQMKNWERYFAYKKIKGTQKMYIEEIYDEPFERIDGRSKGGRSIYIQSIEVVLLNYLSKQKGYTKTFTKNKLYPKLGMVNDRYSTATNTELIEKNPSLTDFDINHFRNRTNGKLNTILMSALNNLENRFLIDVVEQVVLVDAQGRYSIADDMMRVNFTTIKNMVSSEMGFATNREIFLAGKMADFYKGVNYYLRKIYGYDRAFTQYKILYNPLLVQDEAPKLAKQVIERVREIEALGDDRIRQELITMNNLMIDAFNNSAEKNYIKTNSSDSDFNLPYNYLEKQAYLTDTLVRIKDNQQVIDNDMSDIDELFNGLALI